jgi:peptidyl-prolyl cis-trans isomerase C
MKASSLFLFILASLGCTALGWTQTAPPASPASPDTVVATFDADGTKITLGEFQTLLPALSDTWRPLAESDPVKFLHVYGVIMRAAAAAESQKLAEKTPYKQGLEFAIRAAMAQFYVQESMAAITVTPEELEKYYNEHKEPFRQIKVSGIKVAFGVTAEPAETSSSQAASRVPKKALTEDEAKAKADKLVARIRAGENFAKLVQTDSDDETSKAKGGDLGVWKMTDNVPDALRAAVLGLKEGEVSEPIRQAGSFYIVHADAVTYTPLADVKDALLGQLKQEKAKKWLDDFSDSTKVEIPKNDPPPPPSSDLKK